MNFTKSQIVSMYGSQFFLVEGETADIPVSEEVVSESPEPVIEKTIDTPLLEGVGDGSQEPVTPETVVEETPATPIIEKVNSGIQEPVLEKTTLKEPTNTLANLEQKIKSQESAPPPIPPTPTSPVSWKMRKTATVALVMAEKEFSNKMMTMALKNCVEAAGVSTAAIGFGVMAGDGHLWDFSDMPVPTAVVFAKGEKQEAPEGKTLHQVDSLSEIVLDPDKQNILISLLQKIIQ